MADGPIEAIPSKAAIAGHPIHPMLVPFPIASLVGALIVDIVFWSTGDPFWARAGVWLLLAGVVSGALAAVFGLADFLAHARIRSLWAAWAHMIGNAAAVLLAIWNASQRWDDPTLGVLPVGIVLSALVVLILLFTGWLGGELAFRHRIGVVADAAPAPTAKAREL
jgi:uncharacterized membrane protein